VPYALFDTPLGPCALAWTERGILAVNLPEATRTATRDRIAARSGDGETEARKPPPWIAEAIAILQRHLRGEPQDLRGIRLDMSDVPPFHAKVYAAARDVEAGRTAGYGDLARLAGSPAASRAVGQAMAKNPFPIIVPCHRVLAAGGKAGGFSAYGGTETKAKLLEIEGVRLGARSLSLFDGDGPGLLFHPEEAVRALSSADAKMRALIEKVGPLRLRIEGLQSPFEALAESIVYQQLTGKAAATILARVHKIYGPRSAFTPAAVRDTADAKLREAGLSGAKTAALKDLAAKTLDGTVPKLDAIVAMTEGEIVERLTEIRGIGRWTVEMLLIFRLGRPDVLPIHDYGVRKGYARAYRLKELPTPKELEARGERWRPFRTAASWYLWRANELPVKKTAARGVTKAG
jgi:methylated-DNA-[protein]-cysteine S-methyltransferase